MSTDALRKIEQVLGRDPVLRDVLAEVLPRGTKGGGFTPDIDVIELESSYVILLDLPGVAREGLSVELDGNKLVVSGDKPLRHPELGRIKVGERRFGAFKREFLLPVVVDGANVRARLQEGVLRIDVPRVAVNRTVNVEIGS